MLKRKFTDYLEQFLKTEKDSMFLEHPAESTDDVVLDEIEILTL